MDGGSPYMSYGGADGGDCSSCGILGGYLGGTPGCTIGTVIVIIAIMWLISSAVDYFADSLCKCGCGQPRSRCPYAMGFTSFKDLAGGAGIRDGVKYADRSRMGAGKYVRNRVARAAAGRKLKRVSRPKTRKSRAPSRPKDSSEYMFNRPTSVGLSVQTALGRERNGL